MSSNKYSEEGQSDGAQPIDDQSSDGDSKPDRAEGNTSVTDRSPSEGVESSAEGTLVADLIKRRIPQVLAGYLGVTWTLFELMQWLTEQYLISPHLGRVILFGLLMMTPAVVLVTYRHGRPGPDAWTSLERWGIAANVLLALLVLGLAYGDVELGSMVKTVQAGPAGEAGGGVAGDSAGTTVRQVPKKEFRKRIALFYFDKAEGTDADTALRRAVPMALKYDLAQDSFISLKADHVLVDLLRDRGYEDGLDVPLGLKQEVAERLNCGYILSGSVGQIDGGFQLRIEIRDAETGTLAGEHEFEGEKIFSLVDEARRNLKETLELPAAHVERTQDLPVTQVFTSSLTAARQYAQGNHLHALEKERESIQLINEAVRTDSTFALAHTEKALLYWGLGQKSEALSALENAGRHSYRLLEPIKYFIKVFRLQHIQGRPEMALEVCEQWVKLHPDDIRGWELKAEIERQMLRHESALQSVRRVVELGPDRKEAQFDVGESLLRAGRYEEALDHFEALTEKYPKEPNIYKWIGIIQWKRGKLQDAEDNFSKARLIDSNADQTLLARLYEATGKFEEARAIFEEEVADAKGANQKRGELFYLWHHFWLTGQLAASRQVQDSLKDVEKAIRLGYKIPTNRIACEYYGSDSVSVNDAIDKLQSIQKEVSTPWYRASAKIALAQCEAESGATRKANNYIETADSLIRESGRPLLRYSLHLHHTEGYVKEVEGNFSEATQAYRRHLDTFFRRPGSFYWKHRLTRLRLALAYQKSGDMKRAEKTFRRALELYPAYPRLNYHYGQFLAEQGKSEQALEHLDRALEGWGRADSSFSPKQQAEAFRDSLSKEVT